MTDQTQRLASIEAALDHADRLARFAAYDFTQPAPPPTPDPLPFDQKAFEETCREHRRTFYDRASYGFPSEGESEAEGDDTEPEPEDDISYE